MNSVKLFKTLLIPSAVLVSDGKVENSEKKANLCRPSDLPIYSPEPAPLEEEKEYTIPSYIEEGFATIRHQVNKVYTEVKAYQRVGADYLEQSKDQAEWLLKYLRQEDNTTPKAGAIAIGGLTGLIFGLRGRFFKRTLYTATGALGMAAVCYPKEASEYSQVAITEAKKYATIAYNFAYGGAQEDRQVIYNKLQVVESEEQKNEVDAAEIVTKAYESTSEPCDSIDANYEKYVFVPKPPDDIPSSDTCECECECKENSENP